MRKGIIVCLVLACAAFSAKAQKENSEKIKVGDTMPAFNIVSDNGDVFKSSDLEGKVVLVNFFATWCPPCQLELAAVQAKLWPKLKDNADFKLLVIGRDHTDAELKKYNIKKGFTFPLYPDKGRIIFDTFASSSIPRSYLIGKDGKVINISVGYTEEEFGNLMSKIEAALK